MWIEMQSQVLRRMDLLAERLNRTPAATEHLQTGHRGEREALFHLRKLGYTVVATRWKTAKQWGDLDLIGWHGDQLCFVEIKTRSRRDTSPAEAAVDHDKQDMIRKMAKAYLRRFPEKLRPDIPVRFDVLSVYLLPSGAEFDLYQGAFGWR
jgi:putative endonuclease